MAAWRALPASWQTRSMWSHDRFQLDELRVAISPRTQFGYEHPVIEGMADDAAAGDDRLVCSSVSWRWLGTSVRLL